MDTPQTAIPEPQELRLQQLVQSVNDVVWEAAADGSRLMYMSPSAEGIYGRPVRDFMANPQVWLDMIHPDDRTVAEQSRRDLQAKGRAEVEYRILRPDGSVRWLCDRKALLRDQAGRAVRAGGIITDVTQHKLTEQALRGSEQRFKVLFEMAPDAYFLTDLKGTMLDGNRAAETVSGYAREELIGKNVLQVHLAPAVQLPKIAAILAGSALGQAGGPEEFTLLRKDGRRVGVEIRTYPVTLDDRTCVLAIARDVSARKGADELLRASEERYRALVETTGTGFVIIDLQGRVLDANREYLRLTGREQLSAILGRSVVEWTAAHHAEKNARAVEQCARDGLIRQLEVDYVDGQGRVTPVEINATVVATGGTARILTLVRDITPRKEAQTQILAYQQQLRALTAQVSSAEERERRRLAADLHDHIGQTLAVAKMKLGRVRRDMADSPGGARIGEVYALIDRMIQDTRSLAFQLSPPLLHELGFFEAVEWLAEQYRAEHGLAIAVRNEGGPLPLGSDLAGMLFRGVRELLINVVKHARAKQAEVTIGRDGARLRIEVRDDGCGFDATRAPPEGSGSGFGLFSLRERLSYLGGRLEIESARGKGTRAAMVAPLGDGTPVEKAR
jgi:PAS domain S-box-containing protein